MKKYLLVVLIVAWSNYAFSDDIDLYIKNTVDTTLRPNVLIILDNSGSMLWDIYDNELDDESVNNSNSKAYVAREVIIDLINDNPGVDFALQLFNPNSDAIEATDGEWVEKCHGKGKDKWCEEVWSPAVVAVPAINGGRIIFGFNDLSDPDNKTELMALLYNEADDTYTEFEGGVTPLCETLYETYRYLSGGEIYYGDDAPEETPPSIISMGSYTSPFKDITCDKEVTIIYITDGSANEDDDAVNVVPDLTGDTTSYDGNYLGNLGRWMATINWLTFEDIDATSSNDILASVKIHTVGFGAVSDNEGAVELLKLAARDGELATASTTTGNHDSPAGGEYHQASDAAALKSALEKVIFEVQKSSTLTSASVSANSFDPTQTLDAVYYGLFEPTTAARWQGNLKKYKIVNGVQVDVLGNEAVDSTGEFDEEAKSFWSTEVDGNDVNKGGVAEMLRTTATTDRKLFTDITGTGKLTEFSKDKITTEYTTDGTLIDEILTLFAIELSEVDDIDDHIKWAMGVDVDDDDQDGSTTDVRSGVFGDPLHSKPVVINYGDEDGNSRIVVGTNAGVLHMFEDKSDTEVIENWAYLPSELFKNIKPLRDNERGIDNKIYGLDGEITLHINDLNNDGVVQASEGETVWLFFGLRRGGHSYYALDVTYPTAPKLMWHIENTGDFKQLGLTFSQPQVVKSAFNTVDNDQLVVVFGGGYDTKKDVNGPNTLADDEGSAIYMVNARTGTLIFKQATGKNNGIAARVATLDSDSDGLVDRLYVGDTGGSVWRLDMPDHTLANTSIIELASLSETDSLGEITNAGDRRFFNQVAIVRTYILETYDIGTTASSSIVRQEVPYDTILLGSGDRATPINGDTTNMLFMIKDKYIKTQQFGAGATTIPTTIILSALFDITKDPFKGYPTLTAEQKNLLEQASSSSGWHFDLEQTGEKSTSKAIVLNNVAYFTTYTPSSTTECSVVSGDGWLYAVDLALGFKKYNWSSDTDNREDRIKHIGNKFMGTPTLISTPIKDEDTGETNIELIIVIDKEILNPGVGLQTMRTSLTIQESL